jgi:LemA protein
MSRFIEFCCSVLVSFLVLAFVSLLSLRPALKETRAEAVADWDAFVQAVHERNDLIPGLVEGLKSFEPGHAKLALRLIEAKSISALARDPKLIVQWVDEMDKSLLQIGHLVQSRPELDQHPPFSSAWKNVTRLTDRVLASRRAYNKSVRLYNRLLKPFPQNLLATMFGFVPLQEFPSGETRAVP